MAEQFEALLDEHVRFIEKQKIFFVATAARSGRINLSPKGQPSLSVLGPRSLLWLNLTGSGNETAAHLLDDDYQPVTQPGFAIEVSALDEDAAVGAPRRVTLRPDASNPGLYEGYFVPPRAGRYRVEANATDRPLSNTTEFQVADVRPELANTDMQIEHLRRIADLSGGETLGVLELKNLPALLNREPHPTTIRTDRPLWDNALVAALLVILLGFEWILRRKYDLP